MCGCSLAAANVHIHFHLTLLPSATRMAPESLTVPHMPQRGSLVHAPENDVNRVPSDLPAPAPIETRIWCAAGSVKTAAEHRRRPVARTPPTRRVGIPHPIHSVRIGTPTPKSRPFDPPNLDGSRRSRQTRSRSISLGLMLVLDTIRVVPAMSVDTGSLVSLWGIEHRAMSSSCF